MTQLSDLGPRPSPYTPDFTFIRGEYRLGDEKLPYFCVTMPFKEANRFLRLARDTIFDPTEPIPLDELIQRELNSDRVKKEIVPYLRRKNDLKFFNAITVALLPSNANAEAVPRIVDSYAKSTDPNPPGREDNLMAVQVGGIQVASLAGDPTLGRIRWNTDLIWPIILDGQHRFAALQDLTKDERFIFKADLEQTEIPLILLVLSNEIGFKIADPSVGLLTTCRKIFIDLNKHAINVSKARQILMDDRDITAVCMRSILNEKRLSPKTSAVAQIGQANKLPLALVDWWSGKAKFEGGHYLSSVLALYDMTSSVLRLPAYKAEDPDQVQEYIDKLTARLSIPEQRAALLKRAKTAVDEQVPFEMTSDDIRACVKGFDARLAGFVIEPLTRLRPYTTLIDRLVSLGLLAGPHEVWASLDSNGKQALEATLEPEDGSPRELASQAETDVKGKFALAFNVVFQKAFVRALVSMADAREELLASWGRSSADEFGDAWCARFNEFLSPALASEYQDIWLGAGRDLEGKIDFTQRGSNAIVGFVVTAMLAPFAEWRERENLTVRNASDWLLKNSWSKIKKGSKSSAIDALHSSLGRFYRDSLIRIATGEEKLAGGREKTLEERERRAAYLGGERLIRLLQMSQQ